MGGAVSDVLGGFGFGPGEEDDPFFGGQGVKPALEAGKLQAQSAREALEETRRQFDVTQELFRPRIEAGDIALESQQALIGLSGEEAQQQALQSIDESPGQKFLRDRAQRNLLRNASAVGGLGGGNVRSALVQQGVGFAQQDIQNQFGRLGQIAGQGQQAGTTTAQLGAEASGNIAGLIQAEGAARASGLLGAAQVQAQAQGNAVEAGGSVVGFLSDRRLKTDIKKVGEDKSGNIYQFKYINSAVEYIGRMAQELQKIRPDAVSIHSSGYLQVSAEFAPEVV